MLTTVPNWEFDRDVSRAKKAALAGPVLVTDQDQPTHVLLSFEGYQRLQGAQPTLDVLLGAQDLDDIQFEPQLLRTIVRPENL